jgi:methyl-accepting chemotaxis protein
MRKIKPTLAEMRAEAAEQAQQIEAARARVREIVRDGGDTGPLRGEIAKRTARLSELNIAIFDAVERQEKGDLLAIDAEAQRITAEVRNGIAALIEAMQPPAKPVQA